MHSRAGEERAVSPVSTYARLAAVPPPARFSVFRRLHARRQAGGGLVALVAGQAGVVVVVAGVVVVASWDKTHVLHLALARRGTNIMPWGVLGSFSIVT